MAAVPHGGDLLRALFPQLQVTLEIVNDYSCALIENGVLLLHGRLFATRDAVFFASSMFGKETKRILPYDSCLEISKCYHGRRDAGSAAALQRQRCRR